MSNRVVHVLSQWIVVVGIVGMLAAAPAIAGTPAARVETGAYDFGTAFEGADIIHDYIIKNTGDADLEIQNVKTG